jgi:plasmid stability protein
MYALNAFSQDDAVATLTVSHLPDKVYSVLQMRAVQYKHHAEAEAREILTSVVKSEAVSKWRKLSRN